MNGFQWNSWQVVTAINRWNDDSLTETVTGTRELRQNNRIDVNRCRRDVIQVLTPSERIHKFHCTQMRPQKQFNISLTNFIIFFLHLQQSNRSLDNILHKYIYTIYFNRRQRHLQSSTHSLPLLLAMATLVWKTFTMDVGQMQQQRHHMTACSLVVVPYVAPTGLSDFRQEPQLSLTGRAVLRVVENMPSYSSVWLMLMIVGERMVSTQWHVLNVVHCNFQVNVHYSTDVHLCLCVRILNKRSK